MHSQSGGVTAASAYLLVTSAMAISTAPTTATSMLPNAVGNTFALFVHHQFVVVFSTIISIIVLMINVIMIIVIAFCVVNIVVV